VGSKAELNAMDTVRQHVSTIQFLNEESPIAFVYTYFSWETNRIIGKELVRNLVLASVCVFIVTLFLIANLWTSIMVLTCVAFTLIDICGYMYFWGLTIDFLISTVLVVALGFAVDYAAHIGHAFMAAARDGNRNDRAQQALVEIGPAVFNGGLSTFLAFVLLAWSKSYAFKVFFKIFFLVVSLGLFHGLVYLPIFLSIIGPRPYRINIDNIKTDKRKMKDKSSLDTSSDTLASPGTSRPATVLVNNNNLSTESILNATSENNKPQVDENGVDNGTYVNAEA